MVNLRVKWTYLRSNSYCRQEGEQYFFQHHETGNRWDEAERKNETVTNPQRKMLLHLKTLEKFEASAEETDVQEMKKSSEKLLKWMPVTAEWLTQGVDMMPGVTTYKRD